VFLIQKIAAAGSHLSALGPLVSKPYPRDCHAPVPCLKGVILTAPHPCPSRAASTARPLALPRLTRRPTAVSKPTAAPLPTACVQAGSAHLSSAAACSCCRPPHLSSVFPRWSPPSRACPSTADADCLPRPCLAVYPSSVGPPSQCSCTARIPAAVPQSLHHSTSPSFAASATGASECYCASTLVKRAASVVGCLPAPTQQAAVAFSRQA
jgi:hypothetical protein